MRTVIIYHSDSGHTQAVAEYLARQTGADLIRVTSTFPYTTVSRAVTGVRRAISGTPDPIEHREIDVAGYDCVVAGSPVWAGHPSPVINGAIDRLRNCQGKAGVAFVTCCLVSGGAAAILSRRMEDCGLQVKGSMVVHGSQITDYTYLNRLVTIINRPWYGDIRVS
ncbi:MAG: ArsR family transcriptional regulator [Methanomicrobiales archaeon]|nr:ArsR family transcriptional regulator [Methanomicrobiales archaeon]